MGETVAEVYENAAGLLARMGYVAFYIPAYIRPPMPAPVVALATDADPVLVGFAIGQVAVNPEAFLPTTRKPGGRPKDKPASPPLGIWF